MGSPDDVILFETRFHAKGGDLPSASYPPLNQSRQVGGDGSGGLLSLLSVGGLSKLKEKWNGRTRPKASNKQISMFVSPNGQYVAVASYNQITILQEGDNFIDPCGIFTCNDNLCSFKIGAWLEHVGILGVVDDVDTIYIIKSNGEEISRAGTRQLKLNSQISGLIAVDDFNAEQSMNGFCIVTADGSLYCLEVTQDTIRCIFSSSASQLTQSTTPFNNVSCLDFHRNLSLIVMVHGSPRDLKNEGTYLLHLWRIGRDLKLELLFTSPNFEGHFPVRGSQLTPSATAKVLFSPKGTHIATLDMNGSLDIYYLKHQPYSLSAISYNDNSFQKPSDESKLQSRKCFKNIVDFTWWSDQILILSTSDGHISMLDVICGWKQLGNNAGVSKPLLEKVGHCQGHVFALDCMSSEEHLAIAEHEETSEISSKGGKHGISNIGRSNWNLVSLTAKSVTEMYDILIQKQEYHAAFEFARRFQLNEDDIYKSQWLNSGQRVDGVANFLSKVKDQSFVLSECLKVGCTEDTVVALLSHGLKITEKYKFSGTEDEKSLAWKYRMIRLQLLQCKDRLETFLGINMGRFTVQEYHKFLVLPLNVSAVALAEGGKIGALNLLFKRHPCSLGCKILDILAAIPETVPVQSYGQLLPGIYPSGSITLRDEDWVESEKLLPFISDVSSSSADFVDMRTEIILKLMGGSCWPSVVELTEWYKSRARDIDNLSGQLDNCLSLVDFACCKGVTDLRRFLEDITYLNQLIYSDDEEMTFSMSLVSWEQLSDYEKFKMMLQGVKVDNIVARLYEKALPFMHNRFCYSNDTKQAVNETRLDQETENVQSFLVSWLMECAVKNQMDICLAVVEEGCKELRIGKMFKDEVEVVKTTLECLYLCTLTDCWNTMAAMLSRLPRITQKEMTSMHGKQLSSRHGIRGFGSPLSSYRTDQMGSSEMQTNVESLETKYSILQHSAESLNWTNADLLTHLEKRVKIAEGHVEVGRLLTYYQVPKPLIFLERCHSDEKNVKQLLRLVLSKFSRRQPERADNEWASMWRDLQCFQEKAFSFLDKDYVLAEFCQALLKAGKFSLARSYLKGSDNVTLAAEKAENLVVQAAKEYFFSAPSLDSSEIWKAKECLSLFSNSSIVKAEADVIDALTTRLPALGVTLLPVQYKQKRNPMEIINMVIECQSGAYLDVDELIEIAKLLGLRSQDDLSAIQETMAREAFVAGNPQVAYDLCLILTKKGHGPIWDLASAIAKGPQLENMDLMSRRQLLGFALSHCDNESIGELLRAWKEIDMQVRLEKLMLLTGTSPPKLSIQDSSFILPPTQDLDDSGYLKAIDKATSGNRNNDQEAQFNSMRDILSAIVKDLPAESIAGWENVFNKSGKFSSFVAEQLPWLLKLCSKEKYGSKASLDSETVEKRRVMMSVRVQATVCILTWLAMNNVSPSDDLIASLAKAAMESPVSEEEDVIGCSLLLNLIDALNGVKIIEEQLTERKDYQEVHHIMNLGMVYSSLQSSSIECSSPSQRRMLLLQQFHEEHKAFHTDEITKIDEVQSTFWSQWESKLDEQKRLAGCARELEGVIPGVEASRFLSGDMNYIEDAILVLIDSVKLEKKHIMKDAVKVADAYGLARKKVLLRYLGCALVSEHWTNDEILAEVSDFKDDVIASAKEVITMIYTTAYPEVEGHNKMRLSYIYSLLSACYMHLKRAKESLVAMKNLDHSHNLELFQYYKILEQQCRKVSFIKGLNFKRIAGLHDLIFECFNEEVCVHICKSTVEALANMVKNLTGIYEDPASKGLITWQAVYRHHIFFIISDLENNSKAKLQQLDNANFLAFVDEIEKHYEGFRVYINSLSLQDKLDIYRRCFIICVSDINLVKGLDASAAKSCLLRLLDFWSKLVRDITEIVSLDLVEKTNSTFSASKLLNCFLIFKKLVMEDEISVDKGWGAVSLYVQCCITDGLGKDRLQFSESMVFSGCALKEISEVFSEGKGTGVAQDLYRLYIEAIGSCLSDLGTVSGNRQKLHGLIASLCKLSNDLEDLKMVRSGVWERLSAFSDDAQLSIELRVYALQLMQAIIGRNFQSNSLEHLDFMSWEGWDEPSNAGPTFESTDAPSRLTSTLIALKSTELAAAISPGASVTSSDLNTLDSAVSCFARLSEAATSRQHFEKLQNIVEIWEEMFTNSKDEEELPEVIEEKSNWSGDEWGEGWESLGEEPAKKEVKRDLATSVHPLHACWMKIIEKLIKHSQLTALIELMDRSLLRPKFVLLSEDEARELWHVLNKMDCFIALKTMLLLPYQGLWFESMTIIEDKLKDEGFVGKAGAEHELLVLILSSDVLSSIIRKPYRKFFSYVCYSVGCLSQLCQEDLVKHTEDRNITNGAVTLLFSGLLFPSFVAELVLAGQYLLAGYIISQWMHTHASFSLINVAEVALKTYLEEICRRERDGHFNLADMAPCGSLVQTCSKFRKNFGALLESSLLALQSNVG